jgi:hypothetical protein
MEKASYKRVLFLMLGKGVTKKKGIEMFTVLKVDGIHMVFSSSLFFLKNFFIRLRIENFSLIY